MSNSVQAYMTPSLYLDFSLLTFHQRSYDIWVK